MNPMFEIQRADECIWLRDVREPDVREADAGKPGRGIQEIHMVPTQAIAIAVGLLQAACPQAMKEYTKHVSTPPATT